MFYNLHYILHQKSVSRQSENVLQLFRSQIRKTTLLRPSGLAGRRWSEKQKKRKTSATLSELQVAM